MSSDQNNSPPPGTQNSGRRRSSFVDLFGPRAGGTTNTPSSTNPQRRLSITTLGLSTMPGAPTPSFGNPRTRGDSLSSANSGSVDESPFEDDSNAPTGSSVPTSPFARRMSFGAKALRDVRNSSATNGNANEGYDFAENLRARAERTSTSGNASLPMPQPQPAPHQRSKSVAVMEPPKSELPKQRQVPDAFQERILKGDFYMD